MNTHRLKHAVFLLIVLVLSICVRVIHLVQYSHIPAFYSIVMADVSEYWNDAQAILQGGTPFSGIHAPLYPHFLAFLIRLSSNSIFAVRLLQSLFALLAGLLLYSLLNRRFRELHAPMRYVPGLAFCFYALSPTLIAVQSEFFSENLALIFLLLSVWFYDSDGRAGIICAGICAGLAVLTHPLFLFFPLCLFAFYLFQMIVNKEKRSPVRRTKFIFFPVVLATVFAYILLRSISVGQFVPIQEGSMFNFWLGNHVGGPYTPGICSVPPGDAWHTVHASVEKDSDFLFKTVDSWRTAIEQNHFSDIAAFALKLFYPLAACELTTWSDLSSIGLTWIHRCFYHTFWILLIPALTCIFLLLPSRAFRKRCEPLLFIIAAFYLAQLTLVSSGRYRIAMHPACAGLAAYFLCSLSLLMRKKRIRKTLYAILISVSIVMIGMIPRCRAVLTDDRSEEVFAATCVAESALNLQNPRYALDVLLKMPDWRNTSVANRAAGTIVSALMELGDFEKAKELLLSVNADGPFSPNCPPSLLPCWGRYYAETGNSEMAEQCYRDSFEHIDGMQHCTTIYNYGVLLQGQGKTDDAELYYKAAAAENPAFVKPWTNLGIIAMEKENFPDAVTYFRVAYQLDPHNVKRIVNYAAALAADGQKNEAEKILRPLVRSGTIPDYARDLVKSLD